MHCSAVATISCIAFLWDWSKHRTFSVSGSFSSLPHFNTEFQHDVHTTISTLLDQLNWNVIITWWLSCRALIAFRAYSTSDFNFDFNTLAHWQWRKGCLTWVMKWSVAYGCCMYCFHSSCTFFSCVRMLPFSSFKQLGAKFTIDFRFLLVAKTSILLPLSLFSSFF